MLVLPAVAALVLAAPTPPRTVAEVDDPYALRINPGGLGFVDATEFRLLLARDVDRSRTDLGGFFAMPIGDTFTLAVGADWDDVSGDGVRFDPAVGLGARLGWLSLGAAYSDGPDGLGFGWTARPARWLSFSASMVDATQKTGRRLYDLGLALRPFGERFSLGARWRLRHGGPISFHTDDDGNNARPFLDFRAEIEPLDGVLVAASSDLHARIGFSLGVTFERTLMGAAGQMTSSSDGLGHLLAEVGLRSQVVPTVLRRPRVAIIELAGDLRPDPSFSLLSRSFSNPTYGAAPLRMDAIAESDQVSGAFVKIGPLAIGWGKATEIRDAIVRLKEKKGRVDCYLTGLDDLAYWVATACNGIAVPPSITLSIDGVAANATFFGDALDRLGVTVETERVGRYKTAPERYTRSGMSVADRESLSGLVDEIYKELVHGVVEGRKLDAKAVESVIAMGTQTASDAKSLGLVDAVLYPDELEGWLAKQHGRPVAYIGGANAERVQRPRWNAPPKIAVITIDSAISGGETRNLPFGFGRSVGARSLGRAIARARADSSIKAVVLRVDSPGGDAVASDLLARAVKRLSAAKPVIASFGDVAASGGYYVAAPARIIFAEPTTITGSIGVFSLGFSYERLMSRLGIAADEVVRGEFANRHTSFRDKSPAEQALVKKEIEYAYEQFLKVVADGRHMKRDEVHAVAQGRVWSGRAAKKVGLVDEIGGLTAAIRRAKAEAGLHPSIPVQIIQLPSGRPSWPDAVRRVFVPDVSLEPATWLPRSIRRSLRGFASMLSGGEHAPVAALPFALEVD